MYNNSTIILNPATTNDSLFFYKLYSQPEVIKNYSKCPVNEGETAEQFAQRIILLCNFMYTIRLKDAPDLAIGDCAIHHWNKHKQRIYIGGSLLPAYWGKGYMQAAFDLLIETAVQELGVKLVFAETNVFNVKAIRLAEKLGFIEHKINEQTITMAKYISKL